MSILNALTRKTERLQSDNEILLDAVIDAIENGTAEHVPAEERLAYITCLLEGAMLRLEGIELDS
jgi:hypothetical protein